jgi:hypothetical protein
MFVNELLQYTAVGKDLMSSSQRFFFVVAVTQLWVAQTSQESINVVNAAFIKLS